MVASLRLGAGFLFRGRGRFGIRSRLPGPRPPGRPGGPTGLEGPVPAPRLVGEGRAAGDVVVPGVEDLIELDRLEPGLAEPVADLERFPELLPEPLEEEPAEGEVVVLMLGVVGGKPL